jgi:hypothetical protein
MKPRSLVRHGRTVWLIDKAVVIRAKVRIARQDLRPSFDHWEGTTESALGAASQNWHEHRTK